MAQTQEEFARLECPRCGAPLIFNEEILICQYCDARLVRRRLPGQTLPEPAARSPARQVCGFTLVPYTFTDPQTSTAVYTILVPQGWKVNAGLTWLPQRPAAPTHAYLQVYNPQGLEAFESFPDLHFCWSPNPLIQLTKPTGSLYFGIEVQPMVSARDCMRKFALPRYRPMRDLVVVDEEPATELQEAISKTRPALPQNVQYRVDSVRMRLHYTLNNQLLAEEISGVCEYTRVQTPGLMGGSDQTTWKLGSLTSFRAAREKLDSYAELYRAMVTSVKFNPAFGALLQQTIQGLSSNTIRSIHQIGDLSRQISRNNNEMREQNLQGWQDRSASQDRNAELFSQTIRGVDAYYDPNTGQNVELPGGYTQAWSTPLGEYVLTDNPNFNPNIGSNQTFTPLEPPQK